ncbi:unnamed protein product [Symbiodinium necroappetens]|uniref:C2H2-type domain-containing protein n=1 Tax=Symbiodinium necroappetens TaxID=1628268 RepID=A0A812IX18_9DINO|nr:unnamed protein product [Symbiodinium necroappetens]
MADDDSDAGAGATLSELEDLEQSMGVTPHDHGQGPLVVRAPRGPPPPQPLHPPSTAISGRSSAAAGRSDTPADGASDSDSNPARRWPALEVRENNQRFMVRVQGPPLPDGRFERSPSSSPVGLSSSTSCEAASPASLNSLTWSETSLVLEGPSLEESRGVLCGQFRLELCATCPNISSRSQGARVGALRRKLQGASWQVVQRLAHQYLTESRRQYWANWEYQATHERRPRSVPDDGLCAADGQGRDAKCLARAGGTWRSAGEALQQSAEHATHPSCQIRDGHANEQVHNKYQVCVVQETHWSASSEYYSGKWLCIHSAPAPADAATDRYAGLLVMLSRAHFQDPAVHEVIGGRVVHVRAKPKHSDVSLDIVATYQHVWRSHLSTQENTKLRDSVWDALDVTLGSLPSRNILFACGDYNTNLRPQHPHVGNAVGPATSASTTDSRLPALLASHDLCALNSWHAQPPHTHYSHQGYSQIDYVLTRRNVATGTSRQARPLHHFPVAGRRLAGHLPVEAQLPMLPVHWRPGRPQTTSPPIDRARLLEAATSCNADAAALQTLVAEKLQDLPIHDPHALHTRVNHILQQCVRQVFPPPPIADSRVSAQAPFRASARQTWRLYALLRRPRVATIAAMLHKWKLYLAFARASRALRQQCKDIKWTAFSTKLLQAEEAAQRGDQRTLFQIVRSLTPSPGRVFSRLRDDEGQLLSKNAEVQALVAQGKTTYAQHSDRPLGNSLTESLPITDAEITVQLEATKAAKAVPSHLAPAAAWKLCASLLGPVFGASFRQHFVQGSPGHLRGDLTDAQMVMLPKVGKSPHVLGNLRPIGLMGPPSKALAGALRDRMLEQLGQLVTQRPQFAYTAGRGTLNALLRIHMHVAEATKLFRSQHISRFGMHAGRRPLALAGALSLSLDLSRAFDLADRCSIYSTLEKYQVPHAVVEVVQRLHTGARFVYQAGNHTAAFVPTNGLKQGCKVAPCLWVWYTIALFDTLEERLSETWVRHTPTMFADDCWAHWLIKSSDDLQRALRELQILLCTLEDYKMRINFSKTAILLKLVGKQAQTALRAHTRLKQGLPHLVVLVNGRTQLIPIKTEHEYLGSKVSYHHVADRNLEHRLQAGQLRYHSIQKSLTGRHAITQAHRIRLWAACVFTSTIYSLAAVGLTTQGLQKWETRTLKHLRAIMRKPAHLTRVTNETIWQQAGLRKPGEQLLDQLQQARAKLELRARVAPDITTEAGVLDYLRQHETHLRLLIQRAQDHPPAPIPVQQYVCQHCEAVFLTEHALHIHCGIKHPAPASEAGRPEPKHLFDPAQHSVGGLPHCRACGRKFTKWQYLKHHIEVGACEAVGGASFVHKPTAEVELRAELQPPTQPPPTHQESPVQNLPLVQRPFFQASWARWESLLSNTAIRQELQAHCVLCHFWVADYQHIKQHQRRAHWDIVHPLQMPSDSIMSPDGQGINPEADIFRYVNFQNSTSQRGQGSDTSEGQPTKRPRPEQPATRQRRHQKQPGRPFGASALGPHQDTIKTLTKVIIRQEDQLAELRGDKGFCLFLREDPEVSILPALIQISKDWHTRQDARDATLKSPLRTLLMACLIRRLRELMVLMTSTPESVKKLQAADWMNQAEEWTYFKWSHQEKRLVRDTDKEAIAQPALLEKIDYLLANLRGDVVQKFTSRPRLNEVGDANATTALFFLSISLRGPVAQQVHEHLVQLIGVSALMLIGASLKREIPRRAAIVQQLAEAVFHCRFIRGVNMEQPCSLTLG